MKIKMEDRACVLCGKIFTPGSWNAKYCVNCKDGVITRTKYTYQKKKKLGN